MSKLDAIASGNAVAAGQTSDKRSPIKGQRRLIGATDDTVAVQLRSYEWDDGTPLLAAVELNLRSEHCATILFGADGSADGASLAKAASDLRKVSDTLSDFAERLEADVQVGGQTITPATFAANLRRFLAGAPTYVPRNMRGENAVAVQR